LPGQERPEYANPIELLLTLVGYAVGLGNLWRFPSLCFQNGGAAFLIPYFFCLVFLGLPLFILEMGLGQMFRQGTLGIWVKLGQPRLRGVGIAATTCTFLVALYYNVILAWTIYYLGRTIGSMPSGILPWSDKVEGFKCSQTVLYVNKTLQDAAWWSHETGLFNPAMRDAFYCPATGLPAANLHEVPPKDYVGNFNDDFSRQLIQPASCPARAAARFWSDQALQQSTGMDDFVGFHWGLVLSLTIAWILVYFIIYKGVESSGKVVYVTATLPYVTLVIFFFRAVTLEGAGAGLQFYLIPDPAKLLIRDVWIRAATQIFYSLGVGFGSLIAFASYSARDSDFVKQSSQVAVINCGTSIFAGFVVFPLLGFLTTELSQANPCMDSGDLNDLQSLVSGPSLAFIAFPIAISKMGFGYLWAILFFLTLFCLGIDSQFAMVESVMTVLHDAGIGAGIPKAQFTAIICGVSWFIGVILFCSGAGVYWFNLFDYYTCAIALFFVTLAECIGVAWQENTWNYFTRQIKHWTGRAFPEWTLYVYKFLNPFLISILIFISLVDTTKFKLNVDLMGALSSTAFDTDTNPGGGYLPPWSIGAGWFLGLLPVAGACYGFFAPPPATDLGPDQSTTSGRTSKREVELGNSFSIVDGVR
jgi:SNF family Na+-dependent transporter